MGIFTLEHVPAAEIDGGHIVRKARSISGEHRVWEDETEEGELLRFEKRCNLVEGEAHFLDVEEEVTTTAEAVKVWRAQRFERLLVGAFTQALPSRPDRVVVGLGAIDPR